MNTNQQSESRIVGTKELARRMGKTPRYIQHLVAEKIIPSIQLPGRDRIYDWEKVLNALSRFEQKEIGSGI